LAETIIVDEVLGMLTWNDQLDWWEGRTEMAPGHLIGISVSVEDETAPPTVEVEQARRVLLRLREREAEARLVAAEELLAIYNDEWNDDDPISEEEFMARLTLDDLAVASDGSAELFYQDDNLFAGHTVLVSIGADGNFEDADIAG
jgi:hypothetical protein